MTNIEQQGRVPGDPRHSLVVDLISGWCLWPRAVLTVQQVSELGDARPSGIRQPEPAQTAKMEAAWERMFKREVRQDYAAGIHRPPVFPEESATRTSPAAGVKRSQQPTIMVPLSTAAGAGQVWVNTRSGKYFLPGSRYYGKTKEGAYMTEQEAKARGYVAAK